MFFARECAVASMGPPTPSGGPCMALKGKVDGNCQYSFNGTGIPWLNNNMSPVYIYSIVEANDCMNEY